MGESQNLILQNGLLATIRRLDDKYLIKVATLCPLESKNLYYSVETRVGNELVYLIFLHYSSPMSMFSFLAGMLRFKIEETLNSASGIVFQERFYPQTSHTFNILKTAMITGKPPEICALLTTEASEK